KGEPTGIAADFLSFVMSPDGQKVVEDKGYVSEGAGAPYVASNLSGTLRISGSTSVYPVMEKLVEAYEAINAGVQIQLQQSDSTTGVNDVLSGNIDIGMASRELKDSETDKGLLSKVIALDGIAVIVNKQNAAENMTAEQIRQIFTGEVTDWSSVQ
ncbi:MAG: substrate-binding domain-containing protein, partial [Clostridia bacterium]|nr:substrate-binding domain-containing protein [Clostridia bacterium]